MNIMEIVPILGFVMQEYVTTQIKNVSGGCKTVSGFNMRTKKGSWGFVAKLTHVISLFLPRYNFMS